LYATVLLTFVALQTLNLVDYLHASQLPAALFFVLVLLWRGGPRDLPTRFLGGTILRSSALIALFALNYSKRLLGLRRT
jgi:hypothetical protein